MCGFLLWGWGPPSNVGFALAIGSVHLDTFRGDCGRTREGDAEETLANWSKMPSFHTEGLEQEGQVVAFCLKKHLRTIKCQDFSPDKKWGTWSDTWVSCDLLWIFSIYCGKRTVSWNKIPVVVIQNASIMWKNLLIISGLFKVTVYSLFLFLGLQNTFPHNDNVKAKQAVLYKKENFKRENLFLSTFFYLT